MTRSVRTPFFFVTPVSLRGINGLGPCPRVLQRCKFGDSKSLPAAAQTLHGIPSPLEAGLSHLTTTHPLSSPLGERRDPSRERWEGDAGLPPARLLHATARKQPLPPSLPPLPLRAL